MKTIPSKKLERDAKRCPQCSMRHALCICAELSPINLTTEVLLVLHHRETKLYSNTARLAHMMLENSRLFLRGHEDSKGPALSVNDLDPSRANVVLYPSENSVELKVAFIQSLDRPLTLIVPDGSWRQASRIPKREPALADLPRVHLPKGAPSEYRLRSEPRPECVCTFEAIARAIGIIHGRDVEDRLMLPFRMMIERVLWSRSHVKPEQCRWPIPERALFEAAVSGYPADIQSEILAGRSIS